MGNFPEKSLNFVENFHAIVTSCISSNYTFQVYYGGNIHFFVLADIRELCYSCNVRTYVHTYTVRKIMALATLRVTSLVKLKVANVRAQCQLSTVELASLSHLDRKVIYKAEHGLAIRRVSAFAILDALNPKRRERGLPELDIDDLDWIIQGDGSP
jgi:hypothetical protein